MARSLNGDLMMPVPRGRRGLGDEGASRAGCLFAILVLVAAGYVGVQFIGAEIDFRSLSSQVQRTSRVANETPDAGLQAQIRAKAAELGLPPSAGSSTIERPAVNKVAITVQYPDTVKFFGRWTWVIGRRIHVEQTY